MIQTLANQLIADMKKSWQKTALLGVLLLIGLYFWIPPLLRAFRSEQPRAAQAAPATTPPPASPPIEAVADFSDSSADRPRAGGSPLSWKQADQILQTDPLVRPIEAAAIQSDPFRIDHDQFPPPVTNIFAEEPPEPEPSPQADEDPHSIDGLVLKSTIIGVKQRAAFINGRLYFEGNMIPWKGKTFQVQAIYPRRVVLTADGETYELTIRDKSGSNRAELQSRRESWRRQ
ncbi:MAG: general secretion pathway protein GspB [Planctomycetes bacterium]|nr:general secretion pathway protein GspB [Planctomycetota bacterium]